MNRYAFAVILFLGHLAFVAAVTVTLVVLMSASRQSHASGSFRPRPVAASPTDSMRPPEDARLGPLEGNAPSPPQDNTQLLRPERVSDDAIDAAAPPLTIAVLPPTDEGAPDAAAGPAAVPSPSDGPLTALQQLVAQSREKGNQLGQIDDEISALRRQAANDASRRQGEAEQKAARHAATITALGTLRQAEALLASGSSDGVDDDLGSAEAALSGRTRLDVKAAREALARGDLFEAGQYLAAALAERRTLRLRISETGH